MRGLSRLLILLVTPAVPLSPAARAGAAPGDQMWLRLVHADAGQVSPSWHEAVAVAPTGDVFVAGTRAPNDEDFLVARYTSDGVFKWKRVFDRGGDEVVTDVAADRMGNVVVCGREGAYEAFLVVKYSRAGKRLWTRRLSSHTGPDSPEEVAIDRRGSVYVVGCSSLSAASGTDLCLVKYSSAGRRLWLRMYAKADISSELHLGPDGNVYVSGTLPDRHAGDQVCVLRYSPAGHRDWVRTLGNVRGIDDWVWDLDVRRSGVCGTGQSDYNGSMGSFVFRLRLDSTVKYWHRIAGAESVGDASYIRCGIDDAGRVTIAGWQWNEFSVRRYSAAGSPLNASLWHGSYDLQAVAYAAAVSPAGYVYASGMVNNTDVGKDIWTVGLSPTWQELFTVSLGSPTYGDDVADDLVLASGCFYAAAVSDGDLLLAKYER